MKNEIIKNAKNIIFKTKIKVKKYSPEIFLGLGIAGTVTSTIMACKATTKVSKIMEEKDITINAINKCIENDTVDYNEDDMKKDLTITYAQTAVSIVKTYLPSVIVGGLSILSIVEGHKILKRRNVALIAAYTAVDKGFKNYRKNVVERFGDEVDKELRHNIKAKEIETTVTTKNGKEKKVKETVYEIEDPLNDISEYARFFDEFTSVDHRKDPEYNLKFLRCQQNYANDILKSRGHIFLNEVYDMLGIKRTKTGQMVGWIYNENNPTGDNYIDFGIYTMVGNKKVDLNKQAFVNGQEPNILLDFNVDGIIYDKI